MSADARFIWRDILNVSDIRRLVAPSSVFQRQKVSDVPSYFAAAWINRNAGRITALAIAIASVSERACCAILACARDNRPEA
jgi:hypothetical protein